MSATPRSPRPSLADGEAGSLDSRHEAAARRIAALSEVVDELLDVLERETGLVRAGRLREARDLQAEKSALSARYLAQAQQLTAAHDQKLLSRSAQQTDLRRRLERLQSLMQTNLMVLATAHAVAEGLVRGAVGEMTRKRAPQTYGPGGRAALPPVRAAQPVMLNRNL
jgi:hypothetical protein